MRLLVFVFLLISSSVLAQTSDELFQIARKVAFDDDNYPKARAICAQALEKSPTYTDISIFRIRLFMYDDKYDSARAELIPVMERAYASTMVFETAYDLEYWTDNNDKALEYANKLLFLEPTNAEYHYRKAKVLNQLERQEEALLQLDTALQFNSKFEDAISMRNRLRNTTSRNRVTAAYDLDVFSQTFDPWHLVALSYSRATKKGTIVGRINRAYRFGNAGTQAEVDFYPDISEKMYGYVNFGYSNTPNFPETRFGFSLYRNLPRSFEGEIGLRVLNFSSTTVIYTASLGKYVGDYWINLRPYITPGNGGVSQSYFLTIRKYFSGVDHYLSLVLASGVSPEERTRGVDQLYANNLTAQKFRLSYRHVVANTWVFDYLFGMENLEFRADEYRVNSTFALTVSKMF